MNRIALSKLVCLVACLGLIACGDPEEEHENDNQQTNQQQNDNQPNDNQPNDNQPNDNQPNDNQPNDNQPNDETIDPFSEDCTVGLEPQDDAEENRQAAVQALIDAEPGDIVCFNDGDYDFNDQLSVTTDDLEIRGESRDGVRLDFSQQDVGATSIDVDSVDNFEIRSLTVLNTPGDGIVARNSDGVTFDDVAVEWEGEPSGDNGAYGLYPVKSSNIIVENSYVYGASDAGIYLGQSEYGIIRNNEAEANVAGIEVENSTHVDVYGNIARDNTGGILVFNLPDLERKEGRLTRVFDNEVTDNNRDNFADPGSIVGLVPAGSGVLIIGVQHVEIFDNDVDDHRSTGVGVVSYETVPDDHDDEEYYPYAEGIYVHSNTVIDAGYDPDLTFEVLTGYDDEAPAIAWDGVVNEDQDEEERQNCFWENVDENGDPATFGNFALDGDEQFELGDNECQREPLDEVDFE